MFKIGSTAANLQEMKAPTEFSVTLADLDGSSNRNLSGYVVRDRIATKRKLSYSYNVLTQEEISPILGSMENVFFYVQFPDPRNGTETIQCYVSDRSAAALLLKDGKQYWSGLKFNLVER